MPLSVPLPNEIDRRLDALARQSGQTKADYVHALILEHLKDLEDYAQAAEVLARVRRGEERVYGSAEVRRDRM